MSWKSLPKQHQFDFKVSVNYQNGNVKIRGPNDYCPPQINLPSQNKPIEIFQNKPLSPSFINKRNNYQPSTEWRLDSGFQFTSYPPNCQRKSSQKTLASLRIEQLPSRVQCVICQRSFNSENFEQHLQIHKNRTKKRQESEPLIKLKEQSNIRYADNMNSRTQKSIGMQEQYSFQKRQTWISQQNSIISSQRLKMNERNNVGHSPIIQNPSSNKSLNFSDSMLNEQRNNSFHYCPENKNILNPSVSNVSSVQSGSNIFKPNISNSSSSQHQPSLLLNQVRSKNQLINNNSPFLQYEILPNKNPQIISHCSSHRSSFNQPNFDNLQGKTQTNFEQRNFSMQCDQLDSGYNNSINYSNASNRIFSEQKSIHYPGYIAVSKNFNKKQEPHTQSNIPYSDGNSSQSSIENVMESLQKLSREQMISMSRHQYHPLSVRSGKDSEMKSSQCQFRQTPYAVATSERNVKSMQQSFVQNKPLSVHLHELEMKNLKMTQVYRGVQADQRQIMQRMKQSGSTNSKNSKLTKSSKTRLPKNSLAIFEHLTEEASSRKK